MDTFDMYSLVLQKMDKTQLYKTKNLNLSIQLSLPVWKFGQCHHEFVPGFFLVSFLLPRLS